MAACSFPVAEFFGNCPFGIPERLLACTEASFVGADAADKDFQSTPFEGRGLIRSVHRPSQCDMALNRYCAKRRGNNGWYGTDFMAAVADGHAITVFQRLDTSQIQFFFVAWIHRYRVHQGDRTIFLFKYFDGSIQLIQRAHPCRKESMLSL